LLNPLRSWVDSRAVFESEGSSKEGVKSFLVQVAGTTAPLSAEEVREGRREGGREGGRKNSWTCGLPVSSPVAFFLGHVNSYPLKASLPPSLPPSLQEHKQFVSLYNSWEQRLWSLMTTGTRDWEGGRGRGQGGGRELGRGEEG
jgi:hypothetical protein